MKPGIIIFVSLLVACATSPMARLSITKDAYSQWPNYCKTALILTNLLPDRNMRPVVTLLVYDEAGKIIDHPTTYFDVIQPTKSQTKEALISANCSTITKIHVDRAYEPDAEPGHYAPLSGVHQITYNFKR